MQRRPISPENALARLESLCARSEHCTFEIETKLRGWDIPPSEADKIVKSLTDGRFIDDSRFAMAFARDKFRFSGYGKMKIRLLLAAKRIPRDIIDEAIVQIDEEEYREKLSHLLEVKASRMADADTFEGRTKLFRYAASRGFESSVISDEIKRLSRRKSEDGTND